jgi:hypothetical protein
MANKYISVIPKQEKGLTCLALVKRTSILDKELNLDKPSYCYYEYEPQDNSHTIKWLNGSWQKLDERHFSSLVLLTEFDDATIDEIIGQ